MNPQPPLEDSGSQVPQVATIANVVRDVVGLCAVEELPLVEWLATLEPNAALRRLRARTRRSEQLGFGLGEAVVLVTPILWLVLESFAGDLASAASEQTRTGLAAWWRKRRGKNRPSTLPLMTAEQLQALRAAVIAEAVEKGLPSERAEVIADALISRIARGRAAIEPPEGGDGMARTTPPAS
jgi:hypothetical protein